MVSGIVQDQYHARATRTMPQQRLQKGLERGRVERAAQRADELAGAQADGPKTGHRLAGGGNRSDRSTTRASSVLVAFTAL